MALTKEQLDEIIDRNNLLEGANPKRMMDVEETSTEGPRGAALFERAEVQDGGAQKETDMKEKEEEKKPSLFSRIGEKFKGRTDKLGETLEREGPVTGALATTAAGIGVGFDVATEGAKSLFSFLTPDFIEKPVSDKLAKLGTKFVESEEGQIALKAIEGGMESWEKFREKHPTIATNVESVVGIGELFGAVKGAQVAKQFAKDAVKVGREVVESGAERMAKRRALKETEKIAEKIAPKLSKAEKKLAIAEGRVEKGSTGFFGKKRPDKVTISKGNEKAAETIQRELAGAAKMNDAELSSALLKNIGLRSQALKTSLREAPVTRKNIDNIIDNWDELKKIQLDDQNYYQFPGAKKLQERAEGAIENALESKNLDELWAARTRYDAAFRNSIKGADDLKDPWVKYQRDRWLENREILNKAIEDGAKELGDDEAREAFDIMSDFYRGRTTIINNADIDTTGTPGFIRRHWKKAAAAAAGAAGLKAASKAAGIE